MSYFFIFFIGNFIYQFQDPSMKRNISFASPEMPQVFQISSRNMNLQIRVFEELIVPKNTRWKQMMNFITDNYFIEYTKLVFNPFLSRAAELIVIWSKEEKFIDQGSDLPSLFARKYRVWFWKFKNLN